MGGTRGRSRLGGRRVADQRSAQFSLRSALRLTQDESYASPLRKFGKLMQKFVGIDGSRGVVGRDQDDCPRLFGDESLAILGRGEEARRLAREGYGTNAQLSERHLVVEVPGQGVRRRGRDMVSRIATSGAPRFDRATTGLTKDSAR